MSNTNAIFRNFKEVENIKVGNENCLLIKNITQSDIDVFQKNGNLIYGHFGKNGFIACNLKN